jgi:hypothetical protein
VSRSDEVSMISPVISSFFNTAPAATLGYTLVTTPRVGLTLSSQLREWLSREVPLFSGCYRINMLRAEV